MKILKQLEAIIEKEGLKTQLVIAGEGDFSSYQDHFDRLRTARLLNRKIDDSEVSLLFSGENTITVLPYKDATQSGIINIAASHRSLVIATASGGLPEQLGYGEKGILIPPNDVLALRNAMFTAARKPMVYKEKIENAYCAAMNLTWKVLAGKILGEI